MDVRQTRNLLAIALLTVSARGAFWGVAAQERGAPPPPHPVVPPEDTGPPPTPKTSPRPVAPPAKPAPDTIIKVQATGTDLIPPPLPPVPTIAPTVPDKSEPPTRHDRLP